MRIETHAHSCYSNIRLLDSINKTENLITTAYDICLKGICLTDHEALCGAIEFLNNEKSLKEKNRISQDFKCGIGNEIYLTDTRDKAQKYYHFILIAKDEIGFRQLCELSSKSWYNSYYDRGMERVPTLKSELKEIISKNKGHVIATSACLGGQLPTLLLQMKVKDPSAKDKIIEFINFCLDIFGDDFYFEVAPGLSEEQKYVNSKIIQLSHSFGVKVIYGTDAHYLRKEDRMVHKAYLNSKEGEREIDSFYEFAHLMSEAEAKEILLESCSPEEIDKMCKNSMEIYNKISGYKGIFRNPIIPRVEVKNYPVVDKKIGKPTIDALFHSSNEQERYWVNECWNKLEEKNLVNEKYISRLETEADIIKTISEKLGNCLFEYFNTFQHFVELFWECGSLNGPGRGSSTCFLSNYLLGITQLDPIEWGLMEWRFLNKERLELPDIDTDLSPSKRPLIFKKIREQRGELRLLQVATFGTEGTKSAILSACRGYRSAEHPSGIDVDEAQYIAGLVPCERGFLWTLDEVMNGNEDKDRKPIKEFINEVNKFPGLVDIMLGIEGLVNKRSQHASGVIIYNEDPWNTGAVMRSPNGSLTTQFSLHEAEQLGDTKFDFLVTEICDKIVNCINLLQKDKLIDPSLSLKEVYLKYLHPSVINLKDNKIWYALNNQEIVSLFQFNTDCGGQAIRMINPTTPMELVMANALMRLVGEKGKERPLDRYVRLKNDINQWYDECRNSGLTEDEIKYIEPYYLPACGCPTTQERLMQLCMDKNVANFTLAEANKARKVCAKKLLKEIPSLKEKFITSCPTTNLGEYVWKTAIAPQMSYAFAEPHALAYSFVAIQILILVTTFPIIYWNCACLIVDSSGVDDNEEIEQDEVVSIFEEEDTENYEYIDSPDHKTKVKRAKKATNYGKIATAIGKFRAIGINILPPDINKSSYTFAPDVETNSITYGLKGIAGVSEDLIKDIINERPFISFDDFNNRVKTNKRQMPNLIKSGIFDNIENCSREELMRKYILSVCDQKQRLTLQNMAMLINYDMIPDEMALYAKMFSFNKFLKKNKNGNYYMLNGVSAVSFITNHFGDDAIIEGNKILQKDWDTMYKKGMEPMRIYLKENGKEMLERLNNKLFTEEYEKYGSGNISKWEMDSISFYYHDHELKNINFDIDDFFELPEDPILERTFTTKNGQEIKIFKLNLIAGTVVEKNKLKNTISLLTPTGVVNVKIYKNQYSLFDKQISVKGEDGHKKVIEKSWFSKGTLLLLQGFRHGNDYVLKKYKDSIYPVVSKITSVGEDGRITLQYEREEV